MLAEDNPLALDPIQYWQLHAKQFPVLVKFAINVPTTPAAAADCERTFSELSELLGTWRLCVKPELPAALQSLERWKRIVSMEVSQENLVCIKVVGGQIYIQVKTKNKAERVLSLKQK
jgi:hypothetical protein